MAQINVLFLSDTLDFIMKIVDFIVYLGKYILLIPSFVIKIIEFLFVMISFIPQPFRSVELVLISMLIGFFGVKMIGKVT